MLARAVDRLPIGDFLYEPKWDGVRCIAIKRGPAVQLFSRSGQRLEARFPEIVAGLRGLPAADLTLDGEILAVRDGVFDFTAVLHRLGARRADPSTPAVLIAFDLLEENGADLRERPLTWRRRRLERLIPDDAGALRRSPATTDPQVAEHWLRTFVGPGVDGVMAKPQAAPYRPDQRTMFKLKPLVTIDCVVGGARRSPGGYSSLLLGLFRDDELRYIGSASGFSAVREAQMGAHLAALETSLEGHPWSRLVRRGAWVPLQPREVCEVVTRQVEHQQLRGPATFLRWRADRDPRSCTLDQLAPENLAVST